MQNEIAVFTIGEAAETLGVSSKSIKHFITEGKLEAFTLSDAMAQRKHLRVTAESLRNFIKSQTITGGKS